MSAQKIGGWLLTLLTWVLSAHFLITGFTEGGWRGGVARILWVLAIVAVLIGVSLLLDRRSKSKPKAGPSE